MQETGSKAKLTPYDKARAEMTDVEYKAWVEQGIWPKRIARPKSNA